VAATTTLCLKGYLDKDYFTFDNKRVKYLPYKDRKYHYGEVYASFRINGGTYMLLDSVPV
jgi:hypothetical protein